MKGLFHPQSVYTQLIINSPQINLWEQNVPILTLNSIDWESKNVKTGTRQQTVKFSLTFKLFFFFFFLMKVSIG